MVIKNHYPRITWRLWDSSKRPIGHGLWWLWWLVLFWLQSWFATSDKRMGTIRCWFGDLLGDCTLTRVILEVDLFLVDVRESTLTYFSGLWNCSSFHRTNATGISDNFHDASKNALCFECVWIVSVKLWMFRENTSMLKCIFQVCCLDCHRTSSTFPCPSWHLNGRVMVSSWWSYPSMASWACNLMHLPVLVNHPWSRKSCQVWRSSDSVLDFFGMDCMKFGKICWLLLLWKDWWQFYRYCQWTTFFPSWYGSKHYNCSVVRCGGWL